MNNVKCEPLQATQVLSAVIQQVRAPIEPFDHPANHFIANFAGTVCLFGGTLKAGVGAMVIESEALGTIAGGPAALPNEVEIAFRTHVVTFWEAGAAAGRPDLARGRGAEAEFLGEFIRHTVHTGKADIVADQVHYIGARSFTPGDAVKLGIQPP